MLEKISSVIQAITEFLGGFSKLNEVKDHSVSIFFKIILCTLIALFLGKLFLRDDLYDWVVSIIMKPNPITIGVIVGLAMILYSMYAQKRVRELAFLNKGLRIILVDDREIEPKKEIFVYEGGISEYVKFLNKGKTPIHEQIVHLEGEEDNISVEVAMQYNTGYTSNIYSFTNNINTHEGGTHEDGVKRALTRIINSYGKKNKFLKDNDAPLTGDDVREGLTMIISCKHPDPQFEGQTKAKLGTPVARTIVESITSEKLKYFLEENKTVATGIINKALKGKEAREAARRAREETRNKRKVKAR